VSTKTAKIESKDGLKIRLEEATRYIDLDRLAISPQCGFASLDTGNPISPQVQERKLRLVVEVAQEIGGGACASAWRLDRRSRSRSTRCSIRIWAMIRSRILLPSRRW